MDAYDAIVTGTGRRRGTAAHACGVSSCSGAATGSCASYLWLRHI
jgi:hypothetical protein